MGHGRPLTLEQIRLALAAHDPPPLEAAGRRRAAVALVLHVQHGAPQALFIERTQRPGDLWSGHLALPGGTLDPCDPSPRHAAERETAEEVGLDLLHAARLGRLGDIDGGPLPLVISAFVYCLHEAPSLVLDPREVQRAFWFPLAGLADPANRLTHHAPYGDRPALRLLPPGRPVLWGLTYRLVREMLELLGHELP